ncbi:MAG: LLM class flavin-dependent oxidoreductase [Thermodesulfobacteriota bacterium]|jgi:alkanesulfonate monooxygenase SsuD/methylene tetrahydromethanopterin reductase-like flavin-dependent oxidoreductase (luciferase family)
MKFMLFLLPTIPATLAERKKLRPIANHTDRWQMMFEEVVELARLAEDLGFDALAFPEHHLHSEGFEVGGPPEFLLYVALHTRRIRVGPIGYVLPGWDPLRLAITTAWLDQLTKGRSFVGFARGYQQRWLDQMAQKINISATVSDHSAVDDTNRRAFEEVYQVLKLAWADEPFRFRGEFYEYPHPYDTGTLWPPHQWTREYGAVGEVDAQGRLQKIAVVPKPYQKPHPPLFQAFSISESTIRWCAREGVAPMILLSRPEQVRHLARVHVEEAGRSGRWLALGEGIGVLRQVYFADNPRAAERLAEHGLVGVGYRRFWGHFGFWEAFRFPEDDVEYPGTPLPMREWTVERMIRARYLYAGSVEAVRERVDELVETVNPEWFAWLFDQGLLPRAELKKQLELFGSQVLPRYRRGGRA